METKLTLKLDQSIINSAKKYAKKNNRSLSWIVESYFRTLVADNESKISFSPLVKELSAVISEKDLSDLDY
ncbi:MAG: hypothetical protein JXR91_07990, partial [Deltaproteobacteria bacterium]|nr:hypothetical protein [Deltaproteobacteria bacterium]